MIRGERSAVFDVEMVCDKKEGSSEPYLLCMLTDPTEEWTIFLSPFNLVTKSFRTFM